MDRLLSNAIHRYILDPAILPTALRNVRGALFPNNAQGSPTLFPPSSDQELRALRRRCASALWAHLVPRVVGRLYFGGRVASWLAAWWKGDLDRGEASGATTTSSRSTASAGDPDDLPSPTSSRSGPRDITTNRDAVDSTGASARNDKDKDQGLRSSDQNQQQPAENSEEKDLDARIVSEIESDILDVFGDAYCNKHLMYGALELILVRLIPELAEKGVMELWEERLS